jgi:hypothetical protein
MRAFAVTLLALCLSAGAAMAQTDQEMIWALGEVGGELQECSVYFLVGSSCVAPQEPALARTSREVSDKVAGLAISTLRAAGMSDEAYAARASLSAEAMMKLMGGNCTNIAVLLKKYMSFCQRLSQDADPRLKEWIACFRAHQQTCAGGP